MVEALQKDYTTAPISEQDRVMLDYVVKLTKDATQCSPADHAHCARWASMTAAFCRSLLSLRGSTTSIAWQIRWVSGARANFGRGLKT